MRFFMVFLRFLLNFRGLRTSIIVLPCTREHDPRKIAVFVFGPPCRWILAHFHLIFEPKTLQNSLRDPLEKKVDFWYLFCRFGGRFLGPFGSLGETCFAKKARHSLGKRTSWPSGTPRGRFFVFLSFTSPPPFPGTFGPDIYSINGWCGLLGWFFGHFFRSTFSS